MTVILNLSFHKESDLFYIVPRALSKDAAEKIRKSIIDLIQNATKEVSESDSEALRCLNIDWLKLKNFVNILSNQAQ